MVISAKRKQTRSENPVRSQMGEVRGALLQTLKEAAEELMAQWRSEKQDPEETAQAQGSEGAESTYSTSCIRAVQHGLCLSPVIFFHNGLLFTVLESVWTLTNSHPPHPAFCRQDKV